LLQGRENPIQAADGVLIRWLCKRNGRGEICDKEEVN